MKDLDWILVGEIVQHDHDVLFVESGLGWIMDDQGRRQQLLLLEPHMGVHPVGSPGASRSIPENPAAD